MNIYINKIVWIFIATIFVCCSNEEKYKIQNPQEDSKQWFYIEAYYNYLENQNRKYPDTGAKVYIYFDTPTIDFFNTSYLGEGIYDKRGKITKPDQSYTINEDGVIAIEYLYPARDITIIVESNVMKPASSFHLYSPINPPTRIITVFTIIN